MKLVIRRISWNAFYAWIVMIVTSRIFILAHFPHQCFLAIILGLLSFTIIFKRQIRFPYYGRFSWIWSSKAKRILVAVTLLCSAVLVYLKVEHITGFDINWSIALAKQYCQKVI